MTPQRYPISQIECKTRKPLLDNTQEMEAIAIKADENKENDQIPMTNTTEKRNIICKEASEADDTRSWDEMVITPLNGIPPLGCSPPPPRQLTSPLPYAESPEDEEELQFFMEME